MQTHVMDRIMKEYWKGNLDANGSFMDSSTAYGILMKHGGNTNDSRDFEKENRFYR